MRKRVDRELQARMRDIMHIEGIGWDEFKTRFFRCPWCKFLLWKMVRTGEYSMVLCVACSRPFMSIQIIDFWEQRYIELALREKRRVDELKKSKDDEIVRNLRFYMGDKRLPIFRFDADDPDD